MQSVSSNAVASLLNTSLDDANVVDISSQLTKNLGLTTVHAVRKNNVVQLYLYGDYTGSPSYSTQILASGLPQKYRPMTAKIGSSFAVVSYITSNPYVVPTRLAIGVDGTIRLNETSMPNGAKIVFTVTYIGA